MLKLLGWLAYGLGQSSYDRAGKISKAQRDASDREARLTLVLALVLLALLFGVRAAGGQERATGWAKTDKERLDDMLRECLFKPAVTEEPATPTAAPEPKRILRVQSGQPKFTITAAPACQTVQGFQIRPASPAPAKFDIRPAESLQPPKDTPTAVDYGTARRKAIYEGKPLLVWLACNPVTVEGSLNWHTTAADWHGYQGPAVIVSVPSGDRLLWVATIPAADATPQAIRAAVDKAVSGGRTRAAEARPTAALTYHHPQQTSAPVFAAQPVMMRGGGGGRSGSSC